MTTTALGTQAATRTANALWTLIEPQPREVKAYLSGLINKSMAEEDSAPCMSREEVLAHIEQSCREARLIREGKLKAVSVEELMNEL